MAFHSRTTPEALLPRSDSRNPATTCKGITSNGRPCRRSLAQSQSPRASPAPSPRSGSAQGVLAVVPNVDGRRQGAAAFYCWQHQDQASALVSGTGGGDAEIVRLQPRTSTESLVAQLGVLNIDDNSSTRRKVQRGNRPPKGQQQIRRDTLPPAWQNVTSPLMTVPEDQMPSKSSRPSPARRRGDLHVSFTCCMRATHGDASAQPPIAPRPVAQQHRSKPPMTSKPPAGVHSTSFPRPPRRSAAPPATAVPATPVAMTTKAAASSTYTQALLSFVPSHLDPSIQNLLLAELSKPLTPADREPGYIYIFWLTPKSGPRPGRSDATSLLASTTGRSNGRSGAAGRADDRNRRTSEICRAYSVKAPEAPQRRSLMLKIGRASNVHRRMVEWSRQCGEQITLLRYYPTRSQLEGVSAEQVVGISDHDDEDDDDRDDGYDAALRTKVALVPRVERLIHAELATRRVVRDCEGCGRQHREWFAVDATVEGVRSVDRTVRRWVEWGIEEGKGV